MLCTLQYQIFIPNLTPYIKISKHAHLLSMPVACLKMNFLTSIFHKCLICIPVFMFWCTWGLIKIFLREKRFSDEKFKKACFRLSDLQNVDVKISWVLMLLMTWWNFHGYSRLQYQHETLLWALTFLYLVELESLNGSVLTMVGKCCLCTPVPSGPAGIFSLCESNVRICQTGNVGLSLT